MIHRYPYTDFNEYNLDWVIERVKQLTADWLETAEEWNDTKEDWDTLYNYVHDYFDNLDVSQEVGQIISDYYNDGTLTTICQPIVDHWVETNVPRQINQWLDANITQETGYVLDSSLTLSNAAAPAKTVGDALTDVNNALDDIVEPTSNLFNLDAITENKYITEDGTETSSQNFSVTDYMPVTEGDTIYFWCRRSDGDYLFDERFLTAYNSSKVAVSASGGSFVNGSYTVPVGIKYIRASISNTYLSTYSRFYIGTLTVDEADQYVPYGYTLKAQPQIDENTKNIENITHVSNNLLDVSAIAENCYVAPDGVVDSIQTLSATDYLPVSEGEIIYCWGLKNNTYEVIPFRLICAYDSSKVAVPASGVAEENVIPYVVPNGIAFLRITLRNSALNEHTNLYIGTNKVGINYEPFGVAVDDYSLNKSYRINNGDSILEAVKYCYSNHIKNLFVEAGTYDIIDEYEDYYGADYFTNYIDYQQDIFDAGIWLQDINIKFSSGAKVVCKYEGNNTNVPLYFSAFATGNNVTIEGLVLDCENLRYGIHADYNTGSDETFFRVKNCDLKHYKNATSMQAIGAGFGKHVFWEIENTIFRSAGGNHIVFRVHNSVNSDAQSKLIVKDCYIDGDGYFQFNAYSTSTLQSIIQVCGCSYKTAPVVGKETEASNENFTMIAWNNELRS